MTNTNTAAAEEVVAPLALLPQEIRFYEEEGYLLLPGLIRPQFVAQVREDVLNVMHALGYDDARLSSAQASKDKLLQSHQYLVNTALAALVNSPALNKIVSTLNGGSSTLYLPFTAVKSGGGGGEFHFHQDNQYTRWDGVGLNMWCALSDMTPENGCLNIVPRSHLDGTIDAVQSPDGDSHKTVAERPQQFLPIRMRTGDAVVFTRRTLHGSGPNTTAVPRVAYAIQFHRDDVNYLKDGAWINLKENPKFNDIAPVMSIAPPDAKGRDGH